MSETPTDDDIGALKAIGAIKLATQIDQLSTDIANEAKNRIRHLPAELRQIILATAARKLK